MLWVAAHCKTKDLGNELEIVAAVHKGCSSVKVMLSTSSHNMGVEIWNILRHMRPNSSSFIIYWLSLPYGTDFIGYTVHC